MIKRDRTRKKRPSGNDVALVFDRSDGKDGYRIVRHRRATNEVEFGSVEPLREGRPINGEVISLTQREEAPFLYNVQTEYEPPDRGRAKTRSVGPAQVSTDQYRRGWEAIWGAQSDEKPN